MHALLQLQQVQSHLLARLEILEPHRLDRRGGRGHLMMGVLDLAVLVDQLLED